MAGEDENRIWRIEARKMTPQWPVVWTVNMTRDKQNKIPATLKHSLKKSTLPPKNVEEENSAKLGFLHKSNPWQI